MAPVVQIPEIPEAERTPLVSTLLQIIERLAERVQQLEQEARQLKDEIALLKGQKKRPKFKPSQLDQKAGKESKQRDGEGRRPGSEKRRKTEQLTIHEEKVIAPSEPIPPGSRFKGYRDFVVQDLVIGARTTRYRLERWKTPQGETLCARLPEAIGQRHFGPTLVSYVLYQHHHCQVTQPLLLEQLREWGIELSAGQLNALLLTDQEAFHGEKDALLSTALAVSSHVTVDDTGTRHQGRNGYVTHIGNEAFAWFESTESKSRINFLKLLRAGHSDYCINEAALAYMDKHRLAKALVQGLREHPLHHFADQTQWEAHLQALRITGARHRRIATEGALLGSVLAHGVSAELAIVSDDAGQFNVLHHGLCWVHAERLVHKLNPFNEDQREDQARVRTEIWSLYADLKRYQQEPTEAAKEKLQARFDTLFSQKTRFETLNQTLKRIARNKSELLLVLERPEIPLHTNGSETAIRDYVKKNKVSGGTRSDLGRRCRDTHASLKKTCRLLGLSFWAYLTDRLSRLNQIPPLPELVHHRAEPP